MCHPPPETPADLVSNNNYGITTATAADGAGTDSMLEYVGFDWKDCDGVAAGVNTHTYTQSNLPDGYYIFSVACTDDSAVPIRFTDEATGGSFSYAFKVDNVAPSSAITQSGTESSYDPSPNSGNGYYNGAFGFKLSVTDYYGAVGNPYVAVQTTQNKQGCDTTTATSFNVANDPNTGATETVSCEYYYTTYLCAVDNGAYASCGVAFAAGSADSQAGSVTFTTTAAPRSVAAPSICRNIVTCIVEASTRAIHASARFSTVHALVASIAAVAACDASKAVAAPRGSNGLGRFSLGPQPA